MFDGEPIAVPIIDTVPVPVFETPNVDAAVPPITFPVMFNVPVEEFADPGLCDAEPPVIPPEQIMFVIPVDEFSTPDEKVPPPPAAPPKIVVEVMLSVPVPLLFTAGALVVPKHLISEQTMLEIAGKEAE